MTDSYADFAAETTARYASNSDINNLYEGQLDAVLDAYKAYENADALMRLRYTNPLRATTPIDHSCHGCALDPTI